MALSAAFIRCIPGGVFWYSVFSCCMKFTSNLEHSLSMKWSSGCCPCCHQHVEDVLVGCKDMVGTGGLGLLGH